MKQNLGYFIRNIDAGDLLEMFLISAVFSILLIRLYLFLTGYPQVSVGTIHIAHMLWGGFLLMLALVTALTFLNKESKKVAAIIGGVGFGTFIDELGKFVTADNNYFFQPTISLIYVIFIILFFFFRFIENSFEITKKEYAINALELSKDLFLHDMDEEERKEALTLLARSDQSDPGVIALKSMLHKIEVLPPPPPSLYTKINIASREHYQKIIRNPKFSQSIVWFFALFSVVTFVPAFFAILTPGNYIEIAHFMASLASLLFVSRGVYFMGKKERQEAYISFKWGVLISIFLTQVFAFYTQQLSAIIGFIISIFVLNILQYLIEQEAIAISSKS